MPNKEPELGFYRMEVEKITGGTVTWAGTRPVPEEWWRPFRRNQEIPPKRLEKSVLHIFQIDRSKDLQAAQPLSPLWMGTHGTAYVWAYQHGGSWYYTRILQNPEKGIDSPEIAIRKSAESGRP